MAALPLALAATSLLALGAHTTLETALRSEARARTPYRAEPVDTEMVGDLDLSGRLGVQVEGGALSASATYLPRVTLSRLYPGTSPQVMHGARLVGEWQPGVRTRWRAEQQADFGTIDFSLLTAAPLEGLDTLEEGLGALEPRPGLRALRTLRSASTLTLEHALSRRWRATGALSFVVSGGLGEEAQAVLPRQVGPRLSARLVHQGSRRDTFSSELVTSYDTFSSGPRTGAGERRALTFEALEAWEHGFSRQTSARLGLGVSAVLTDDLALPGRDAHVLPAAEASLTHRLVLRGQYAEGRLTARYTPYVDRFVGTAYQRTELGASARWSPGSRLTLSGRATGALSGDDRTGPVGVVEVGLSYALPRGVGLAGGVRWGWQGRPATAVGPDVVGEGAQTGAFLAVTYERRSTL